MGLLPQNDQHQIKIQEIIAFCHMLVKMASHQLLIKMKNSFSCNSVWPLEQRDGGKKREREKEVNEMLFFKN